MRGLNSLFILSCGLRAQSNGFLVVVFWGLTQYTQAILSRFGFWGLVICRFWFSGGSSNIFSFRFLGACGFESLGAQAMLLYFFSEGLFFLLFMNGK